MDDAQQIRRVLSATLKSRNCNPLEAGTIAEAAETDNQSIFTLPSEGISLEEVENDFVHRATAKTGGSITRAAYLLNISRDEMRYRLKKNGGENFVGA